MLFAYIFLFGIANAHSWVEQLMVIGSNGTFVGEPGYARGNVLRDTPGFNDEDMTYLLPPDGTTGGVNSTDRICMPSQQTQNQTSDSPRLQAAAGASIALRYQENGHVTLPWNQPGKPANRGTMYVYGTTQSQPNDTLLAIHNVWNANGTGGDGRGVLLSTQSFDDGRCYQINTGNISVARQAEYPHEANELMGADMWCQQDLVLPSTVTSDSTYTLYWVWDWPTAAGVDPNLPDGKEEIYTTCMDVDIVSNIITDERTAVSGYVTGQNLNSAAIQAEFEGVQYTATAATTSGNSSSPAAPTSTSLMSSALTTASSPATTSAAEVVVTVIETGTEQPTVTLTIIVTKADSLTAIVTDIVTVTETVDAETSALVKRSQGMRDLTGLPVESSLTSSSGPMLSPSASSATLVTVVVTDTSAVPSPTAISSDDSTTISNMVQVTSSASSTFQLRGRNKFGGSY